MNFLSTSPTFSDVILYSSLFVASKHLARRYDAIACPLHFEPQRDSLIKHIDPPPTFLSWCLSRSRRACCAVGGLVMQLYSSTCWSMRVWGWHRPKVWPCMGTQSSMDTIAAHAHPPTCKHSTQPGTNWPVSHCPLLTARLEQGFLNVRARNT